jgi:hypothetical protein
MFIKMLLGLLRKEPQPTVNSAITKSTNRRPKVESFRISGQMNW